MPILAHKEESNSWDSCKQQLLISDPTGTELSKRFV